jgi:hypothetical protein
MPRTVQFDSERAALFVNVSGVFTDDEFRFGAAMTVRDRDFKADMRVLVDFSLVTEFRVSANALEEFVRNRLFSSRARRAFVVSSGFGRFFVEYGKSCGAPEQIRIFDTRTEALEWLNEGVPPEKMLV